MNRFIFTQVIPPASFRQLNIAAVLLGFSIFLILAVFQPFGTYTFQRPDKLLLLAGYGIIITFTMIVSLQFFRLTFAKWFNPVTWNLRRELGTLSVITFLSIIATYFYHHVMIGSRITFYNFFTFNIIALSTSMFPIALIVVIRYMQVKNYLEKQSLVSELSPKPDILSLEGENKTEKRTIIRAELLFIKAADNYVELYLQKKNRLDRHVLRSTLMSIAEQLDDDQFLQVHRSYIVNMNHIREMVGKSPNYQLVFENLEETVPVSRNKVKEVRQWLAAKPV